ncbi:hypothetical protein DSO57_1005568 [Entomophthora muscae]|uniref:Uncharacterized protein n=1 Tax=Entomophthora muscae TaxID=34485 RepID=A0ACC2UIH1_9FUNG|nr:hypothetical protein DSO57_1005568 [Entomophthora muscae]
MKIALAFVSVVSGLSQCDPNLLSCPTKGLDSCCTPAIGSLVLAQQWISGLGPVDAFTLHGLWPNHCDGTFTPSNGCDSRRLYKNVSQIVKGDDDLYEDMQTYWPSYKGNAGEFWSHEWGKHGTCLSTVEPRCLANSTPGEDVLAYFRLALKNRDKFDLFKVLSSQNIMPGRSYPRQDILNALATMGADSVLICKGKKLQEVRSTFHVRGSDDYVIVDNPAKSNCPSTITYERKV